jgi:hypothetical protein
MLPYVCGYNEPWCKFRQTHWWLRAPKAGIRGKGKILDVTVGQYPKGFDYSLGRPVGFMQPLQLPSKRAQILIDRVNRTLSLKSRP